MEFTDEQLVVINAVKDKLYKSLSYTSQDYEAVLLDLVSLFVKKDGDGLNTTWNNISESDIMFIFMSLLAAHKDILNYMLDYRTQEAFLSTAKEISSVTRIANSFGYKLPGTKTARAKFTVDGFLGTETITVEPFTTFVDDNDITWTYVGNTNLILDPLDEIELFQGVANEVSMFVSQFSNSTKSMTISSKSIAIGNNYNALGCSSLEINGVKYTEVENLYSYNGEDEKVYSLGIDTDGMVYIQLQRFIDLNAFNANDEFILKYVVSNGYKTKDASSMTKSMTATVTVGGATSAKVISLEPVANSFYLGSNQLVKDEIKEAFKSYYASASSLVTLSDYRNYVINIQKDVPEITKCLVIDKQDTSLGGIGDSSNIADLNVAVYALKEGNVELTVDERNALKASIDDHNVTSIVIQIDQANVGGTNPIGNIDVTMTLTPTVALDTADENAIINVVYDYIMNKKIGESLTAGEINNELSLYGYNYFYGAVVFTTTDPTTVQYYEYLNVAVKTSFITFS
jgi:hypothetical protein